MRPPHSKFPLAMSYEDAFPYLEESVSALHFAEVFFQTLIQDSPWRHEDLAEVFNAYVERFPTHYKWSTIRRRLYELRKQNKIRVFDDDDKNPSQHYYRWEGELPHKVIKVEKVRWGKVKTPGRDLPKTDPLVRFFSRLMVRLWKKPKS